MQIKNRYSFEKSRPPSSRKQTVGVDLRLVIIASLVVAMLLIQVVLVETYSVKKPPQPQYLTTEQVLGEITSREQRSNDERHLDESPSFRDIVKEVANEDTKSVDEPPLLTPSPVSVTNSKPVAALSPPPTATLSPTRPSEQVDIQQLEAQLKELEVIQENEDEELEAREESNPPPPPLEVASITSVNPSESPIIHGISVDDEGQDRIVPVGYRGDQSPILLPPVKEHHHHHHSSKSGASASSSSSSTGLSSSSFSSTSTSSQSSHSLSKSCRARRHLFRSYRTPPRIVCFLSSGHHEKSDALDPLWRQTFLNLGFQETQNPSLATFLMSKHSSEPKLKDYCSDSQVVNHVKSTRALTNPVSLSKSAARHTIAIKFHPETAVYGGFTSSTSHSTKKTACAQFMNRVQEYIRAATSVRSTMVAAYVEKHDKLVAKLSMAGLKKLVDNYRKSAVCPHSDDTVVVQAFKNVLLVDNDRMLCSLRAFIYIPTTRPVMVFMSTGTIAVRCSKMDKDAVDLFSVVTGNDTEIFASTANVRHYSLLEFRDRLLQDNRFPNAVAASISLKELIQRLKRAVGGMVSAAKVKLEAVPGRFGLFSVDFVLDSFSLQPTLIKITDVPEISTVEARFPGQAQKMVVEVIRSQQTLLKRAWMNAKELVRPESLGSLSDFELCGYETPLGKYLETKDDSLATGETFRIFPFA